MNDTKVEEKQKVTETPFKADECTPSNWTFDPDSNDDTLIAYNNVTQRSFNGPRELFNKLLRGGK